MEAVSPETLVPMYQATLCNIPEDQFPHSHRRENLKSHKFFTLYAAEKRKESCGFVLQISLTEGI
jgi:hypothetical protein